VLDAFFKMALPTIHDAKWWGGEPIWVTAIKQGKKSATMFWPGSEAPIQGIRPNYCKSFDNGFTEDERVDQVLAWLDLDFDERPAFVSLYFSTIDRVGHNHGPDSPRIGRAVARVDTILGRLVEGLRQRRLLSSIDILIVSDHGMASTSSTRTIVLSDYLDLSKVQIDDRNPVASIRPLVGDSEWIYLALKGAHPHLEVYRKGGLPQRLHFGSHRRVAPILALADDGWTILKTPSQREFAGGSHGFDNRYPSMQGLFIAHGPSFRQGLVVEPFENIHLYALMTAILELTPAQNSGDLEAVRSLLVENGLAKFD